MRETLEEKVRNLGLSDSVDFTGGLDWVSVQNQLRASHVYVQPSVRASDGQEEGLPQATVEAQLQGLPAVVSDSVDWLRRLKTAKPVLLCRRQMWPPLPRKWNC